jgi:hypothetical protein
VNRLNITEDMQLDKDPYFKAFEEEINLGLWTTNDRHTAGLVLIGKNNRLVLADILKSTPAARIDKWRS